MPMGDTGLFKRIRARVAGARSVELPPGGVPIAPAEGTNLPVGLPTWPSRKRDRPTAVAVSEHASRPAKSDLARAARRDEDRSHRPSDEFVANRGAARYAPPSAEFQVGQRRFAVLTVSMSGISVRWSDAALPAVGTVIDGDILIRAGSLGPSFPSFVQIVRVERADRIVAGRFIKQSGSAIDHLLNWLVQLDRSGAD